MRRFALIAAAAALLSPGPTIGTAAMSPGDFPDPSALPSRPELPDPLVMLDGSRVESAGAWTEKRRPELKSLLQHYMYGWIPPTVPISFHVDREDPHYLGDAATKKEVSVNLGMTGSVIRLLLVVPNKRTGPAPAFLGLNFHGNHTVLADPTIGKPQGTPEASRGQDAGVWSVEKVIGRGYALATFHCADVAPDHPGFADGIFPYFAYAKGAPGKPRSPDDFGAVAAWSWGLSRALDFLESEGSIDKGRVAVVGHSRLGKAALLAGAFDERFALTIGHQAGCGGSAPSRGKVGEQVEQINDRFPHWFAGAFHKFNDQVDRLPFDQNALIALAAPRPVLLTNGTLDAWANPAGQFDVLKAAEGVSKLLGVQGLGEQSMPEPGKLVGDRLAYHIRPGKHAMLPEDWDTFLAYADKHLKKN